MGLCLYIFLTSFLIFLQVTVYYNVEPSNHDLVRIIREFQEPIESTTKNPIRLDPNLNSRRAMLSESYELKGAKMDLVIVDGFCSDHEKSPQVCFHIFIWVLTGEGFEHQPFEYRTFWS